MNVFVIHFAVCFVDLRVVHVVGRNIGRRQNNHVVESLRID